MTISLYHATHLASLAAHTDQETGEIDIAGYDAAQMPLLEKQRAVIAHIRNLEATHAAIKAAADEMAAKAKAVANQAVKMRDYLMQNMRMSNTASVSADNGTYSAKLSIGANKAVQIDDGAMFDEQYLLPAKPREPSKSLIKAAIDAGIEVANARVVLTDRLTIK